MTCYGSTRGMTQYWGNVLTARAPACAHPSRPVTSSPSPQQASSPTRAATGGRSWTPPTRRSSRTAVPVSWVSWQRPEDYYTEGMLIWLDADTKIRELTNGQKSLDDFCKRFFGVYNGSFITDPYTLEDVIRDLNAVAPYDWKNFFADPRL